MRSYRIVPLMTGVLVSVAWTVAILFLADSNSVWAENRSVALAPTPPMGWNSYDCYGGAVTEQEVKANADYLAHHLARFGWKYVVVDYYWYFRDPRSIDDQHQDQWEVTMDEYGRLLPALNRFPSAANGQGFKPLADYVHSNGLKFGIHIMRGIPRAAVARNLPILGTSRHARDVADPGNDCSWSTAMHGVEVTKPAGQAYYDSIVALYAQWGVDFIKADDMSRADPPTSREIYHGDEIAALSRAIRQSGRPLVLSLSPGETPLDEAANVRKCAEMWRISGDFWDEWKLVKKQFLLCRGWAPYIGPDHWPDADMLPLGRLRIRGFDEPSRPSRLTPAEQRTHLTLWVIFRSPLMMGGDLPSLDPGTLALLTNPEVLAVDQVSLRNHELFTRGAQVAWTADVPGSRDKYLAVFNLDDRDTARVSVSWHELELAGKCAVRNLWERRDLGIREGSFAPPVEPHGAGLYRITPVR